MEKRKRIMLFAIAISVVLLACSTQMSKSQMTQGSEVMRMSILGEIANADQGYVIRGKKPAEIFTILNPDPDVLEKYVKSGRMVDIDVRIVSGDNVEIEKIDGIKYMQGER